MTLIYLGSRGLKDFDSALIGYAVATVVTLAALVYRDRELQPACRTLAGADDSGVALSGNQVGLPGLVWPQCQAVARRVAL
jgi:hypothetical protein